MKRAALALAALVAACGGAGVVATTSPTTTTSALPGAETESAFAAGDVLGVIGADAGESHWLVGQPGAEDGAGAARELHPTEAGIEALAMARRVDGVVWERLRLGEHTGWLPRSMLAFVGEPDDVTSLYGSVSARTIEELGAEIAGEIEATEIILVDSARPTEVTYDVIGLEDDSVAGYRIRVVAIEGQDGELTAGLVERTPLCSRGLSDQGLCL